MPTIAFVGLNIDPDAVTAAQVHHSALPGDGFATEYSLHVSVPCLSRSGIPARFGITERLKGVPALLIATPEGKLVNGENVFATADAHSMTPQAIAAYLAKYAD